MLLYHAFGTRRGPDPHSLFVSERAFERQIRFVARWLRPLDLSAFLAGLHDGRWPARSVLVTIDDGYVGTLERAAPVLARHGVPAVLFVCPDLLGQTSRWMPEMDDEPLLDAAGLREVRRFGIEVGAHGRDHSRLPGRSPGELRDQVRGSREALADLVGEPPRAFAYPEGLWDVAARAAVRDAGYEVGFSVDEPGGRFAVPRRGVASRDTFPMFLTKSLPAYPALQRLTRSQRWVRRLAARAMRQRPRSG